MKSNLVVLENQTATRPYLAAVFDSTAELVQYRARLPELLVKAAGWVADTLHAYIEEHSDVDRIFVDFEIEPETKRKVVIVIGVNGIEDPEDARVCTHFQQLAALFAESDAPYQDVEPDTALSVGRDSLLQDSDDEVS